MPRLTVFAVLFALVLSACAPAPAAPTPTLAPPTATPEAAAPTAEVAAPTSDPAASVLAPPTDTPAPEVPQGAQAAWLTTELTDARTGATFRLSDFAGKTVFVESMATWCSNCRAQMRNVREAIARLDPEQYVFIGLSVETNITSADLAAYADRQEFAWTFAVLSPEALITFSEAFGRSFTNPPATPHFVVKPDGTTDGLVAGTIHSVDALVAELTAANGG
ncbi:MAG: TlpA family protein disulfide reductase [Anaerolineae bacterium]|jgi:peroxiredoxin|nr:TlpA family protein disulfide reductase [Anaerolineae bacterium]